LNEPHILLTGSTLAPGMARWEMLPAHHAWENDPGTVLGYGNQVPNPGKPVQCPLCSGTGKV
jgi:hypothetical protein